MILKGIVSKELILFNFIGGELSGDVWVGPKTDGNRILLNSGPKLGLSWPSTINKYTHKTFWL